MDEKTNVEMAADALRKLTYREMMDLGGYLSAGIISWFNEEASENDFTAEYFASTLDDWASDNGTERND